MDNKFVHYVRELISSLKKSNQKEIFCRTIHLSSSTIEDPGFSAFTNLKKVGLICGRIKSLYDVFII